MESDYQFHWLAFEAKIYGKYLVVHKTVTNHKKVLEILMSNIAAPKDFLQILTTIITDYITK
jgi:hypothetical protein